MKKLSFITASIVCVFLVASMGCVRQDFSEGNDASPSTRAGSTDGAFYYSFGEKIPIEKVPDKIVLSFDERYQPELEQHLQKANRFKHTEIQALNKMCILTMAEPAEAGTLLDLFEKSSER